MTAHYQRLSSGMTSFNRYCKTCQRRTHQEHLPDRYATRCKVCQIITSQLEQMETEANQLLTPDGSIATVVRNDRDVVIFAVDKPDSTQYLQYNRDSGFGGISEIPKQL